MADKDFVAYEANCKMPPQSKCHSPQKTKQIRIFSVLNFAAPSKCRPRQMPHLSLPLPAAGCINPYKNVPWIICCLNICDILVEAQILPKYILGIYQRYHINILHKKIHKIVNARDPKAFLKCEVISII